MILGAPLRPVISSNSSDCSSLKLTLQPAAMANLSISLLTQRQRKLIVFILMKDKKNKKIPIAFVLLKHFTAFRKPQISYQQKHDLPAQIMTYTETAPFTGQWEQYVLSDGSVFKDTLFEMVLRTFSALVQTNYLSL